jgi:hypothetical protein
MFWLWVTVVCILLLRRPALASHRSDFPDDPGTAEQRDT